MVMETAQLGKTPWNLATDFFPLSSDGLLWQIHMEVPPQSVSEKPYSHLTRQQTPWCTEKRDQWSRFTPFTVSVSMTVFHKIKAIFINKFEQSAIEIWMSFHWTVWLKCFWYTFEIFLHLDLSEEKPPHEIVKTRQPFWRGFPKLRCFHHHFFVIFPLYAILTVLGT